MDSGHYILEGRSVLHIPCDHEDPNWQEQLLIWAHWFETFDRKIADTHCGPIHVSTIFLGLDHSHGFSYGDCEPVLFETMVFGGERDQDQVRCSTYDQAEAQHAHMVERVWAAIPILPRLFYWWTRWLWQCDRAFWRARRAIERLDDLHVA